MLLSNRPLTTTDYKRKIEDHLDDPDTYTALDYDPSNEIRKKVNSYLETLYDMILLLVKEEYLHLFVDSSTTPLFYCLVKIHKSGYPIRPIVSFIASPTYNIAKLISKLLMPSTDKAHPKQLRRKRKVIIIPDTHILVYFDVKALFTSIPMNFAIDCVKSFIEENDEIWTTTRLCTKELMKIIKLSFKANFFRYGRHVYKQIKGTPMGSPSSVVIAEIAMQNIEKPIFQSINHLFWFRYVDDIIACVSKDSVDDILMTINSINDSIQFTKETEVNNTINY